MGGQPPVRTDSEVGPADPHGFGRKWRMILIYEYDRGDPDIRESFSQL